MSDTKGDGEAEHRLLKQFDRERDNQAIATELVTRLRVRMRTHLRGRWQSKAYWWDEIEQGALMRLVAWRHEDTLKRWEGSLQALANALVDAEVKIEQNYRSQKRDLRRAIDADPELVASQPLDTERVAMSRELLRKALDLVARLPVEHAVVLQALIDEHSEDGPRMEDALGLTRREAEARLRQARVALQNLAIDENLAGDLTAFFESEG